MASRTCRNIHTDNKRGRKDKGYIVKKSIGKRTKRVRQGHRGEGNIVDIPLISKKKKEERELERLENQEIEQETLKQVVGSTVSSSFNESPENPVEFMTALVEPAATGLYDGEQVWREDIDPETGEKVLISEIKNHVKILRDLPLGNFNLTDEVEIGTLAQIAEQCEDMGFYDAANFYVKETYFKINSTRGRAGFLQKQLGTKAIELTRKTDEKKKKGIFS